MSIKTQELEQKRGCSHHGHTDFPNSMKVPRRLHSPTFHRWDRAFVAWDPCKSWAAHVVGRNIEFSLFVVEIRKPKTLTKPCTLNPKPL